MYPLFERVHKPDQTLCFRLNAHWIQIKFLFPCELLFFVMAMLRQTKLDSSRIDCLHNLSASNPKLVLLFYFHTI